MTDEDLEAELDSWATERPGDDGPEPDWGGETVPAQYAETLLRRRRRMQREIARVEEFAEAEMRKIREWCVDRTAGARTQIGECDRQLEAYARTEHAISGGKTASWSFPAGTLRLRAARQKVEMLDAAEFYDWAVAADFDETLIRYRPAPDPEPDRNAIRTWATKTAGMSVGQDGAIVTGDGEIVPGVRLVTGERTFEVGE